MVKKSSTKAANTNKKNSKKSGTNAMKSIKASGKIRDKSGSSPLVFLTWIIAASAFVLLAVLVYNQYNPS
jgi:hypothetical protein